MRASAPFVLFVALAIATAARADDAVTLTWQAPSACPTANEVTAEVSALLGGVARPTAAHVVATATVTADEASQFVLILTVNGGEERRVVAQSCEDLGRAAALILAIAVDPSFALDAPPEPVPATTAPSRNAAPPTAVVPATPDSSLDGFAWDAGVRASFVYTGGSIPPSTPSARMAALFNVDRIRLELGGSFVPTRTVLLDAGGGAQFRAWGGYVGVGYALVRGPFDLSVNVQLAVHRVSAIGVDVTTPLNGHATSITTSVGGRARVHVIGPFHAHAAVFVDFPLRRDAFELGDGRAVDRADVVGAHAEFGVDLLF